VVAPPSFTEGPLPDIIAAFMVQYPGVRFKLDARSIETTKNMIVTRVVDCGFMKLPVDDGRLRAETLVSTSSVCVLPADHPLAASAVLTPALLRGVSLILLGSGRPWRAQVDQTFAEHGLRRTVAIETHTHGSACALAARGLGVAIVNALLAESYIRRPLVMRPFQPSIVQEYAFVTSALSTPSRLTVAFQKVAQEILECRPVISPDS